MSHGISAIGSLAVLVGAGLLAGCGTHDKTPAPASGTSAQASSASTPAAPAHYDISRIGAAKAALPAGFDATDVPADTVSEDQLDAPGVGGLSTAAPSVVDPAPCAVLLKPLGATVSARGPRD